MARIRLGMVGGGNDAFIGGVHRIASRIDDRFDLVAGALSSTPEKSAASAEALGIPRSYGSFEEMAEAEAAREDGIEAVSIVTPNHVHAAAAKAFLAKGIHVICDKPLTSTLEDAEALEAAVARADALFILTHNYTGYPMIRQARAMVEAGDLGDIRIVQAEYPQDWLTAPMENEGVKQAEWRTDPARSGAGRDVQPHAVADGRRRHRHGGAGPGQPGPERHAQPLGPRHQPRAGPALGASAGGDGRGPDAHGRPRRRVCDWGAK